MFRVRFTLIGVCDTSTVDDDIRAVDCTEIDDFISICNVQFIKICVQCFGSSTSFRARPICPLAPAIHTFNILFLLHKKSVDSE